MTFIFSQLQSLTAITGERSLVLAKFFFWRHGTHLQNSLDGLYRGLLYDVLASCPGLIAHVFSEKWATAVAEPWQIQTPIKPSPTEIRMAFEKLIESASKSDDRCFCFFIDGLDEFQDTTRVNNREMTEKLHSWVKDAPKSLKLCISSREENVFMTAFSSAPRIRLHELTLRDMENFVREKLACIPDGQDRKGLVNSIVDKAQGIFQWVALVTKSVCDELENGATVDQLKKELEFLPEELDELYGYILRSLKPETRKKAWQTFGMLDLANTYGYRPSLLAYSFLEEYDKAPGFAMAADFPVTPLSGMTLQEKSDHAAKKLNGRCRGLVEPDAYSNLRYAHRSVADFLQDRRTKDTMASNLCTFDGVDALSQLFLAEVRLKKALAPTKYDRTIRDGSQGSLTLNFLSMRCKEMADQPPYEFLSCLETYVEPIPWADLDEKDLEFEFRVGLALLCTTISKDPLRAGNADLQMYLDSPLYITTCLGYYDYPVWKILHDPAVTDSTLKIIVLAYCHLKCGAIPQVRNSNGEGQSDSVLQVLLNRGLLLTNTTTHLWPVWHCETSNSTPMTIWQYFLLETFINNSNGRRSDDLVRSIGRTLEIFLQHKPDLDFSVTFQESEDHGLKTSVEIEFGQDKENLRFALPTWALRSFKVSSLRTWIEDSELENKEHLLKLHDSQLEEIKAEGREQEVGHAISQQVDTQEQKRQSTPEEVQTAEPSGLAMEEGSIPDSEVGDETVLKPPFKLSKQQPGHIQCGGYLLAVALGM